MEWIGARICFVVAADRKVVEKTGILVAHTAKTWRIAEICNNDNNSNNKEPPKEYCVCKEGTKLAVWVPLLDRAAAVPERCGAAEPKFARIEIRYQSI
jgi:Ribonuclease P/MRP, subunit p29